MDAIADIERVGIPEISPGDGARHQRLRLVASTLLGLAIGGVVFVSAFAHSSAAGSSGPLSGDLAAVHSGRRGLRVLFVGNSFTAANGMTDMVKQLAADTPGATCPVLAVQYAPGGSTLANAVNDAQVTHLLSTAHWDAVVLQDQSQLPALPAWRASEMLPAVAQFAALIRAAGATPILFETWGYRYGDTMNFPGADSYAAMQSRLHDGYAIAGQSSGSLVAPVGDAWQLALTRNPSLNLWVSDDKHPNTLGSYLAAVTLWRELAIHVTSPGCHLSTQHSSFTAGLDQSEADTLQRDGASSVTP